MRQSDAELLTIREWESWAAQNVKVFPASGADALTYGAIFSVTARIFLRFATPATSGS